jgi:hypothetical protein
MIRAASSWDSIVRYLTCVCVVGAGSVERQMPLVSMYLAPLVSMHLAPNKERCNGPTGERREGGREGGRGAHVRGWGRGQGKCGCERGVNAFRGLERLRRRRSS